MMYCDDIEKRKTDALKCNNETKNIIIQKNVNHKTMYSNFEIVDKTQRESINDE